MFFELRTVPVYSERTDSSIFSSLFLMKEKHGLVAVTSTIINNFPFMVSEDRRWKEKPGMNTFYGLFRLTCRAAMQIYWNKGKCLHEKRIELPQDWLGTRT